MGPKGRFTPAWGTVSKPQKGETPQNVFLNKSAREEGNGKLID